MPLLGGTSGVGADELQDGVCVGTFADQACVGGVDTAGGDETQLGAVAPDGCDRGLAVGDEVPALAVRPRQFEGDGAV